jgi:hypothetical protein
MSGYLTVEWLMRLVSADPPLTVRLASPARCSGFVQSLGAVGRSRRLRLRPIRSPERQRQALSTPS